VDVGVSLFFQNFRDFGRVLQGDVDAPPAVPDADVYRGTMQLGDLVEPLGFDSIWTVEHHFSPYAMTDNPLQILAYFAGRTQRVGLGTMVVVAPWHDPVRVAEEIAVLDHLAQGRPLYLGFGRGAAQREFDGMRVERDHSRGRWEDALEIVRRALTSNQFSYQGEHHAVTDIAMRPRPRSTDLTTRMYCAWNSEESLQFAAHGGFGQLFISLQSWDHAATATATFNQVRASHGWEPVDPLAVVFVYCRDTETDAAAGRAYLADMMDASVHHYDLLPGIREQVGHGPSDDELLAMLRESFVALNVVGTPEHCTQKLRAIADTIHCAGFITVFHFGDMPFAEAEQSMRLFADAVLPTVHSWEGSDPRSLAFSPTPTPSGAGTH
jgi:alkanesulfonate monooxygenase SsuD/methylene tetrahydromethanopterin reductase-like flavin-dependent oxidoreductase (luciferase family)